MTEKQKKRNEIKERHRKGQKERNFDVTATFLIFPWEKHPHFGVDITLLGTISVT